MIQNSKTVTAEHHTLFRVSAGTTIDFEATTIHKWSDGPQITLGKVYGEQFRRYLMGEEFPEDAVVLIDLARVEDRLQSFFGGVMTAKYERYRQHAFFAPGVIFEIAVGRLIPPYVRLLCALRSHVILSSNHDQRFQEAYKAMIAS